MFSTICKKYFVAAVGCPRVFSRLISQKTGIRTLYSASSLGIDNYVKTREKVSNQFKDITNKFKLKMNECCDMESNNMIFTEDLKHMVHLVDCCNEDMELVQNMLKKFCKQNKEMRFGSFVFGPVVMRMYYFLNKPKEAAEIFKNPDMDGFFDQLISFQILLDLLFKNQMYSEMLDIFNIISSKQLQGSKYPKNAVVLVLAGCYKLNNEEAFNYAKKLWSNLNAIGHYPMRRAATFAAALALAQNSPHIALEILTSMKQQSYVTIRNLKVAALSDLGRPDDALPILKSVLEVDSSLSENKHTFCQEIIENIRSGVEKANKLDLKSEFERIEKQLKSLGYISSETMDSLLCKEIVINPFKDQYQPGLTSKPFQSRNQIRSNQRPGLRNML